MSFGDYWSAMDRVYGAINESGFKKATDQMESIGLGPDSIGTSTAPFAHQVTGQGGFAAKIRSGAGRIELSFIGQGKGNSQQPNPESFGIKDRADLRALAEINKIKTSVHASVHQQSLAGFGQEGFSENARHAAVKEIERAIQFAAEATKGGAIVFHTHEWQRPLISAGSNKDPSKPMFEMTDEETKRAPKFIVDSRTGEMNAVRSDHKMYEPEFLTMAEYEKRINSKLVGTYQNGIKINPDDWVDIHGNVIKREWVLDKNKADRLFERVPIFDSKNTNFKVKEIEFKEFEDQAKRFRDNWSSLDISDKKQKNDAKEITAEELFFKTQLANQVAQAKGNALFHGQTYTYHQEQRERYMKQESLYKQIVEEKRLDDNQKAMLLLNNGFVDRDNLTDNEQENVRIALSLLKNKEIEKRLKRVIESETNSMRHIHESSAQADAVAKQTLERMNNVQSVEKFGLQKTAQTIAESAMLARNYTIKAGKALDEKLYVAAENYRPEMYGSHPDEIRKIIESSRKKFAEMLVTKNIIKNEAEAKKEAEEYIKATIDSGHFNMWRQFFKAQPVNGKEATIEEKNKQFDAWMIKEMNKLAEAKMIGHVHLTDNFGYDDEHLSPGQGNTPIREFVKSMKKNGVKDIIAEAGSFNGETVLHESWAHLGSPVYGASPSSNFTQVRHQHFGYQNQPGYIVGAYSPSNEWRLWTEVDLH